MAESPVEGDCCSVVPVLEAEESLLECCQIFEVLGCDDFALNDGEEDLNLIQPRRVDGQVDEFCGGPGGVHSFDGAGTVV